MIEKIDSYMLCSQMDGQSNKEFQQTISFGRFIDSKKRSSKQTQITSTNQQTQSLSSNNNQISNIQDSLIRQNKYTRKITLKQIFSQYLKDPLSTYTLQLQSQNSDYVPSKKPNLNFGKYTTSIQHQEFHDQLHIQQTQVQQSEIRQSPKIKLTKLSSILRIIQEKKKTKSIYQQKTLIQDKRISNQIKIQDYESVQLDNHQPQQIQKDKQIQKQESSVFLGLQSNLSNKANPLSQVLGFTNRKSQKKTTNKKQVLSPVCENPQRKILKIRNQNDRLKSPINKTNYEGLISGLQFSKKLRKKTRQNKNKQQSLNIREFNLCN